LTPDPRQQQEHFAIASTERCGFLLTNEVFDSG
jgi:hypothetical protein